MPALTKNGATITVNDSQAAWYRKRGWLDEGRAPSMSMTKPELEALAKDAGWPEEDAEAATKQELVDNLT